MAIVEMKRVSLLAMKSDKDRLLSALSRAGCVQVEEPSGEGIDSFRAKGHVALDAAEEKLSRLRFAIGQLSRYAPKVGMIQSMSMPEVDEREADEAQADEVALMRAVEAVEAAERKGGEFRGAETRVRAELTQLMPWRALDVPLSQIGRTRETVSYIGSVSKRALPKLESELSGLAARMDIISEASDNAYLWVVAHRSAGKALDAALLEADFTAVSFSGLSGTAGEEIMRLERQLAEQAKEKALLEKSLYELANILPRLKILYELTQQEKDRQHAATKFASTDSTFLMEGWVPEHACERLEKRLRTVTPTLTIEFRDPLDDEQPPTQVHNKRWAAPFEAVIANYSLPDPRGVDPTFIMAPFFVCFFGMMVSDAGYGLIMAILIPLAIHFIKPKSGLKKIMWIIGIGGLSTVFWGAMFDTWFGASVHPILINPLEQPLEMMGLCLGLGVLHLFVGLGVAAYKNIKRGKLLDAVFDQLLWFALLIGIGMLILPETAGIGGILAIVGAVGIFLTAGRSKPKLINKLTSGFGALYGITSWLSDILSYMRLFGMGLATGVIGMVFNMLAGLVMGSGIIGIVFGVLILVVGHVFNMAINILGAYVHACRLQYIEFFGKFYEDGGLPFTPLAELPRYIAIRQSEADSAKG